jgi:hypothetical protein
MRFTWNPFDVWFRDPTAAQVATKQLRDAEILYLHHCAEAERHAALADMYKEQRLRLRLFTPS